MVDKYIQIEMPDAFYYVHTSLVILHYACWSKNEHGGTIYDAIEQAKKDLKDDHELFRWAFVEMDWEMVKEFAFRKRKIRVDINRNKYWSHDYATIVDKKVIDK